jgi:hypothetical protein
MGGRKGDRGKMRGGHERARDGLYLGMCFFRDGRVFFFRDGRVCFFR